MTIADRLSTDPHPDSKATTTTDDSGQSSTALILCPVLQRAPAGKRSPESRLAEAVGLARSIGLDIADAQLVRVSRVRAATLIGEGVIARLKEQIEEHAAGLLIMDCALNPAQQRNLERALSVKVIDRTGLILEIFGARARTHEGRLQVELAALTFQRSRLVRTWTHLERQRGSLSFVGGPGESQLEIDRRLTDDRIARLKRALERVKRTRGLHRASRKKIPYPVVALVGYTNAGKSTLFNQLTHAAVAAEDKLFATLDPTMRRIALPGGRDIILSDTVGFISDLPTQLVAAFRATLEEVQAADLIVHVRDAASPDSEAQAQDVEDVLSDLGVVDAPRLVVMNKIDRLAQAERAQITNCGDRSAVAVSALTGEGLEALIERIATCLVTAGDLVTFAVPAGQGDALAWLHRHGQVENVDSHDDMLECRVRIGAADRMRFSSRFAIEPRYVAAH